MNINEAFPSDYLKASDLNGKDVSVTIQSADLIEFGKGREAEEKLLLTFAGKKKGLICNKTNAKTIAKLYGDDTDGWVGKPITIGPREVEFQGDQVWAIRVSLRAPGAPEKAKTAPVAAPEPSDNDGGGVDDDVGF